MSNTEQTPPVRLDKWLWAARFYKTRAIAKDMILSGKVSYNGQRAKSSKNAELGATVKVRQGYDDKEIIILKLSSIRKNATQAQSLYQETETSIQKRMVNAEARKLNILHNPAPKTKPDKKQRRTLLRFKEM